MVIAVYAVVKNVNSSGGWRGEGGEVAASDIGMGRRKVCGGPRSATSPPLCGIFGNQIKQAVNYGESAFGVVPIGRTAHLLDPSEDFRSESTVFMDENIPPVTGCRKLGTAEGAGIHFNLFAIAARGVRDV